MSEAPATDSPTRLIHDVQKDVKMTRWQYHRELTRRGGASTGTRRELATAALRYYDVLRPLQGKPVVDEEDYPDMRPITSRLGHEVRVTVPSQRLGVDETTTTVPAIDELNPEYVILVINKLDEVAVTLGFGPSTADGVHNDEATHDDLEALLTARGQSDAVEHLPGE